MKIYLNHKTRKFAVGKPPGGPDWVRFYISAAPPVEEKPTAAQERLVEKLTWSQVLWFVMWVAMEDCQKTVGEFKNNWLVRALKARADEEVACCE